MIRKNKLPLWLLILLVSALALSACSNLSNPATPVAATPEPLNAPPMVNATGIVVPARYSTLGMSTSGTIEEMLVEKGAAVQEGQVLVRLKGQEDLQAAITGARYEVSAAGQALNDLEKNAELARVDALQRITAAASQMRDAQYQLDNFTVPSKQKGMVPMQALDATRAALDQARQNFEPYRNKSENDQTRKDLKEALDDAQSDYNAAVRRVEYVNTLEIAQANLDKARGDYDLYKDGPDPDLVAVAQARLENAKASLSAAQSHLSDLELHAPFDGVITELYFRSGEWLTPGQPVLQIADLDNLRVETTDLNEIDAARLQVGSPVKITFDALPDAAITGHVASIAPKSSQGSGVNYLVIIELDEWPATLRWGMTAFVDIEVEE